jgi:hypothetical protein
MLVYAEGVNASFGITVACALAASAWAQHSDGTVPRFEDYPVAELFKGKLATPILTSREQIRFRARITEGITKGWGVWTGESEMKERPGPNFAGHYVIVRWGCGAGCRRMAVVDARSGQTYAPPMSSEGRTGLALPQFGTGAARTDFRLNSRLFQMDACSNVSGRQANWEKDCFSYYFLWRDNRWVLLHRMAVFE